jgi:eukaryotic-like serine/threonine-protein kinase
VKDFIAFIKTKTFLKHFGMAVASLLLLLFLCFQFLGFLTDHGETIPVPDFKGKKIQELEAFIVGKEVNFKIIDSIYLPEEEAGLVMRQDPEPGTAVKHNRTIYLYVTSTLPPQIEMPQFADRSLRQALIMIESYGLKRGSVTYESGDEGAVLRQVVNGRSYSAEEIKSAKASGKPFLIKKGTSVSLVVGQGNGSVPQDYTSVSGLLLSDAMVRLASFSCKVIYDAEVKDTAALLVYRQYPDPAIVKQLGQGSAVSLYVTEDGSKVDTEKSQNE